MPGDVHVDTAQIDRFADAMKRAPRGMQTELRRSMGRAVKQVEADAKKFVPVKTGHLQRSITSDVGGSGVSLIGRVGTNLPYARAVEEGRGYLVIRPKKGRFLVFEIDGVTVFATVVLSPPRPPRPYLRKALLSNRAAIHKEFGQVPGRVFKQLAR